MDIMEKFKEKTKNGELLCGTLVFCGNPMLTECMAQIGFDMLWICTEHTAIGLESLQNNLIAAKAGGTPAMVRVPWNDKVLVKPVLDMGPDAILFPNVKTPEEAEAAVKACEYPPYGERGFGPIRAINYNSISQADYVNKLYRKTLRFIQIEDIKAVNRLEEIVAVKGIDGYIVGPNDLSASVGHLDNPNHPDMIPIYDRIGEVMKKHNKFFGTCIGFNEKAIKEWQKRGAGIIFCGTDIEYVHNGCLNMYKNMKKL